MAMTILFVLDESRLPWGAEVWNANGVSISRTSVENIKRAIKELWPGVYVATGKESPKNSLVLQLTGKVPCARFGTRFVNTKVELWTNGHMAITNPKGSWDGVLKL